MPALSGHTWIRSLPADEVDDDREARLATDPPRDPEDVAKYAQVSRALVSIVMRDAPGASSTTRERVRSAARELGYRPDVRRAVYCGARVLILDEPTAALGVKQSGVVLKYTAAARHAGLGVVFITYNPHHAYLVGTTSSS